jgi:hypothetical protein
MCGSTGTQSKAPATNRALAGKVDGQVSGLLLCSDMTVYNIPELDGGRKPSCRPHPMASDNSMRRDYRHLPDIPSVQDQLGDVACAAGGRKSRRMPTQAVRSKTWRG